MQPDTFALAIMWTVWGLAVLAVAGGLWLDRRRVQAYREILEGIRRRRSIAQAQRAKGCRRTSGSLRFPCGVEGKTVNPAPETLARFGR